MKTAVESKKKKILSERESFMAEGPGKSFIEPRILFLLSKGDAHGYDIISRMDEVPLPGPVPDTGAVYRKLREMEDEGLISSRWEDPGRGPQKRVYRLKATGKRRMARWVEAIRLRAEMLNEFVDSYESGLSGTAR